MPDPQRWAAACRRRSAPAAATSRRRSAASRCCTGLRALADDPATRVIVLISKPPAPAIAQTILGPPLRRASPSSCISSAPTPDAVRGAGLSRRGSLQHAGDCAVALADGAGAAGIQRSADAGAQCASSPSDRRSMAPTQRDVRGLFTGGTFCYEAQLAFLARGLACRSNAPVDGVRAARRHDLEGHVFIDMGDDDYTRGRPHPMIDPSLRNAAVRTHAADPRHRGDPVRRRAGLRLARGPGRRSRRSARGRAARGASAGTLAVADRPRLRHRRRSAGPGRADTQAGSGGRDRRRQQLRGRRAGRAVAARSRAYPTSSER